MIDCECQQLRKEDMRSILRTIWKLGCRRRGNYCLYLLWIKGHDRISLDGEEVKVLSWP